MTILLGAPGGGTNTDGGGGGGGGEIAQEWSGLQPIWTGWDGSVWDLSGRSGGIALLRGGIRGLAMPEGTHFRDSTPAVAGSRWRGWQAQSREVFWPLFVYGQPSSQEWLDWDAAFWRTMNPTKTGTWAVTHPNGSRRELRCRFENDGGQAFDMMPTRTGWARYGIYLTAETPYWQGDPIVRTFEEDASQPFFGGNASPSGGPPFYISSANTLETATIDNPGDVEAFPVYVIDGPTSTVSVGLDGQRTVLPFTIPAGVSVTVDTSPVGQSAVDSTGRDRTSELGDVAFVPVPAGESVPLSLSMVGTGRVTVTLVPQYLRAW